MWNNKTQAGYDVTYWSVLVLSKGYVNILLIQENKGKTYRGFKINICGYYLDQKIITPLKSVKWYSHGKKIRMKNNKG